MENLWPNVLKNQTAWISRLYKCTSMTLIPKKEEEKVVGLLSENIF